MTQNCATCRYFLPTDELAGTCRRFPPTVIVNQSRLAMEPMKGGMAALAQPGGVLPAQVLEAVTVQSHFPQLSATDGWCGCYEVSKELN